MPDREQAIAEIQSAKLNLIAARDLLTPITDFMDLGLIDPVGAYNYIRLAIDECTFAIEGLQQAPGEPLLYFEPTSYTFEYPSSAAGLTITNNGSGTLSGTVTVQAVGGGPAPSWLTVQPQTFSLSQGASSAHSVNMEWQQFPTGQTLHAEVAITSNGGTGVMAITAHRAAEPPVGEPVLSVQPVELVIPYPTQSEPFEIFNSGDQSKMISWTVAESQSYSWMSQQPTSGTVTSERDSVEVIPDWNTWPTNQGIVVRSGDLIVTGTYQGNPVQGSPKTVYVNASRNTGTPSGLPPNCSERPSHPGTYTCIDDENGNHTLCGLGAWTGWCTDDPTNGVITTPAGNKGMRRNCAGLARTDRYITPSNDCWMSCDLKFPQDWIDPINLGGQHFCGFGICASRVRTQNCLRLETHAPRYSGQTNAFGNGVEIQCVETRNGETRQFVSTATRELGIWQANVWHHFEFAAVYNPNDGRTSGYVMYDTLRKNYSIQMSAGNPSDAGLFVFWGNIDGRDGYVEIRNLTYRIGGQSLPL